MAVHHVTFHDQSGPFKAVVESSGEGVRVTFDGWGSGPFVATAARVRIIYRVAGRRALDCTAEVIAGGAVRVRPADRPVTQGRRIIIGPGERATKGVGRVGVEVSRA
jgi:hypothetical protein